MKHIFLIVLTILLTCCAVPQPHPGTGAVATNTPQANMPNPASLFCEQQGNRLEIRTAADGSQSGACIFPDGSECDEWAYYRGECGPANQSAPTAGPPVEEDNPSPALNEFPTPMPIDPAGYQGWWTYTHTGYGFSIMLPEDWTVEEASSNDQLLSGHLLNLRPNAGKENIRMTFRRIGEEVLLWPTGVGQGEFISQGTLDIAGQPAQRMLLVCPTAEVTAIWYHQAEGQPNITRGDLEFGFIFSAASHCDAGYSLSGKNQLMGEMIIASLKEP